MKNHLPSWTGTQMRQNCGAKQPRMQTQISLLHSFCQWRFGNIKTGNCIVLKKSCEISRMWKRSMPLHRQKCKRRSRTHIPSQWCPRHWARQGEKKTEHRLPPISECICICVDIFVWFFQTSCPMQANTLNLIATAQFSHHLLLAFLPNLHLPDKTSTTGWIFTRKIHENPGQLSALFMQPGAGSPEGSKVWFTIAKILLL